jgi:hypothetical protein
LRSVLVRPSMRAMRSFLACARTAQLLSIVGDPFIKAPVPPRCASQALPACIACMQAAPGVRPRLACHQGCA